MEKNYDILIVGGGPAGCTAALALEGSGLKVGLLEKSIFPRDKICGDAIPGPALKVVRQIREEWGRRLMQMQSKEIVQSSKIFNEKGNCLSVEWVLPAYNAKRLDFDFELWNLVREKTATQCVEKVNIAATEKVKNGFLLKDRKGNSFTAKLLLAADGANSFLAKQLADFQMNRRHHSAAVRVYVEGVENIKQGINIFYLFKRFLPGYFWLFPISATSANVGFGMLSAEISKRKINLKQILRQLIREEPKLRKYFQNAKITGKITGFGLPLGSRFASLSGDHFMLLGDAGSLIDPLQGHGIDKAMISAYLAAEQAKSAFGKQQFDATFLKQYDYKVYQKFGAEFKRNYRLMKGVQAAPWLIDVAARFDQSKFLKSIFRRWS
ncbi:MAG: geranylgeranyl reductase family protein [Bacteroidota bacterium]